MLINLCYCLTRLGVSGIHLWDLFQNISCYCLTYVAAGSCWSNCISKHLMLLFNCISTFFRTIFCTISKHLMLLFNQNTDLYKDYAVLFQNISCYCLTRWKIIAIFFIIIFQNISCYCLTLRRS